MKNFLLLFLSTCCLSVYLTSQNIQLLTNQNSILANGDTITVSGTPQTSELIAYVKVKNISLTTVEVSCRKWLVNVVTGSTNVFCWAGLCYPPYISVSQTMNILPDDIVNDFSGHYYPNGINGISYIMYTFDVRGGDTAWFYVKYDATGQQISSNTVSKLFKPYPNPASKEVNIPFNLSTRVNAQVEIYDILGKKQQSLPIKTNANVLTIPITWLKDGIYFVQLVSDGKIIGTEKIVIKK